MAADVEYVVRSNLHPVTQEAADAVGLDVRKFSAASVTPRKHLQAHLMLKIN